MHLLGESISGIFRCLKIERWQQIFVGITSLFLALSSLCYPFEKSEGSIFLKRHLLKKFVGKLKIDIVAHQNNISFCYSCKADDRRSMRNSISPFLSSTACKCKAYWSKRLNVQHTKGTSSCLWSSTSNLTVIEFVPIRHVFEDNHKK